MGILSGRAAVVTGGGRGIGRGHCLHLAEQGAAVVVNDIDPTEARKVCDEIAAIMERLRRLDASSAHGAWTARTLALIEAQPATLAASLAAQLGRERLPFKADVRKLKALGLTISLERGYRLSPRGVAVLRHVRSREK